MWSALILTGLPSSCERKDLAKASSVAMAGWVGLAVSQKENWVTGAGRH